ncbi:hypothetical protein RSOLAG22IIIB_14015 [Rhizoctonia solani]|uniref:Uncharacterized protein n=1 Tax=Rhizoctonia solani TaxID=456999 RepID=A0A0K6FTJ0_9AGAM|nr:hypothetical protein RSOLAG22IIIB_14015 [Rhizoctonia solani]
MPTTRKSNTKSTKATSRKKGSNATASPPPNPQSSPPVDPAAVAALQSRIADRDNALEFQERRISELIAQPEAASTQATGNATIRTSNAISSHVDSDKDDMDEAESMDVAIDAGVGLALRTDSSVPSGFSRRTNQVCTAGVPTISVGPATAPTTAAASATPVAPAPVAPVAPVAPTAPIAPAIPVVPTIAGAPPAAQTTLTGAWICHPGGRVNDGCDLCVATHLTNNVEALQGSSLLWMFSYANLPINVYWKNQDLHRLLAISNAVIKAFPYLRKFQPPSWPVFETLKIMLRNQRGYRKRTAPTTAEGSPIDDLDGEPGEVNGA